MRSRSLTIGVFFSLFLVTIAAGLYWMARTNQPANHRLAISLIQRINQIESRWSVEAARVRADPLSDFDGLISFIPLIERLKAELSDTMRTIPDLPERMRYDLNAYLTAIDAKEERVERFKTGYAVLRNSIRYLPQASSTLINQIRQRNGNASFVRSVSTVTDDITAYITTPTPPEKERLTRVLVQVGNNITARYPVLTSPAQNLVGHGLVLLDKYEPTEAFFQEATSSTISDYGESLSANLKAEADRKEVLVDYYENGILASGGALWLMWLAIALRLPKNAPQEAPADILGSSPVAGLAQRSRRRQPNGLDNLIATLEADQQTAGPARAAEGVAQRAGLEVVARQLTSCGEHITGNLDILDDVQAKLRSNEAGSPPVADEELKTAAALLSSIRAQAGNIVEVADRLPSLFQTGDKARERLNINDCIDEAVESTKADTAAVVVKELNPLPKVLAAKADIGLIVTSVLDNSLYALEHRSKKNSLIRIETKREDDTVLIIIADNGDGIEAEHRKKVFEPFYTSRPDAKGMGLATAQHVVQKYEGSISLRSLPGQGTMVRIALPGQ